MTIWLSPQEIVALPTTGASWEAVLAASKKRSAIDLSDQDSKADTDLLALALVAARMTDSNLRRQAIEIIDAAPGTEDGGRTLALGRNLQALVIAADIVQHTPRAFCSWLEIVMRENLDGKTLLSTHERRPNNWGTHAGAARVAADWFLYKYGSSEQKLRAMEDGIRTCKTWREWMGGPSRHGETGFGEEFTFSELDWQADPKNPKGINPKGSMKDGHSIDGVLPDDQRRAGAFTWPPPKENYCWEALQGAYVAATIMARAPWPGPAVWQWSDRALLRAVKWLIEECQFPASGDDEWITPLVNKAYGTGYNYKVPTSPGKGCGFTCWTHTP